MVIASTIASKRSFISNTFFTITDREIRLETTMYSTNTPTGQGN